MSGYGLIWITTAREVPLNFLPFELANAFVPLWVFARIVVAGTTFLEGKKDKVPLETDGTGYMDIGLNPFN